MPTIQDPEIGILAGRSQTLQSDYNKPDDDPWTGSPFDWIRARPSRRKGVIGEKLLSGYLACKGFDVASLQGRDSETDRTVGGKRAEIKTSTLWSNGSYRFQQLRNQNYDFAVCLGLSPFDAHCWVLPKKVIMDGWERVKEAGGSVKGAEGLGSQHAGRDGKDTAWLQVRPDGVPAWLKDWGGKLSDAVRVIGELTGRESRA